MSVSGLSTAGMDIYVPDTSVLLDGSLRKAIQRSLIRGKILIHTLIVKRLELDYRRGSALGYLGIKELQSIMSEVEKYCIQVEYVSSVPARLARYDVEMADEIAREIARELNAVLVTSDEITRDVCSALGIKCLYLGERRAKLKIEDLFDSETMSVHLKEGSPPCAKKGRPGDWRLEVISNTILSREQLEDIIRELVSASLRRDARTRVEIKRDHSMIVQHGEYRIVIVMPPVSDGVEITITRPIIKKRLEDYNLPEKLIRRIERQAEGILIAGPPGAGKTTFAQALAEYYLRSGKIVKTIESPRDMVLPERITRLSKTYASSEELHDVLLLSRPDYTIFDEMRDTADFQLYVDLRLAGVGMVGVVHATSPIDAIQRFLGRIDVGMIPSVVDTVLFMRDGFVSKVYSLELVVKVPEGLREEDLARPVVVVKDFLSEIPEYEIYVFGEETFVVPVRRARHVLAGQIDRKIVVKIMSVLKKYVPPSEVEVERVDESTYAVRVSKSFLGVVVSRCLSKLESIKRKFNVDIRVETK